MNLYRVKTRRFWTVTLVADSIDEARRRGERIFPRESLEVWRVVPYRRCERCESAPCAGCEPLRPAGWDQPARWE